MTKCKLNLVLLVLLALTAGVTLAQSPSPKGKPAPPPVVTPAKAVADASAPAGWRRYQFGEHPAFSVILPSEPQASAERLPTDAINNMYSSENANGIYLTARLDGFAVDMGKASPARQEEFFKEFFGGFAQGFQETLAKNNVNYQLQMLNAKRITTATGREGYQQEMTVGPLKGQAQLVFLGTSGFCVLAIWNEKTPAGETQAFFNSFRLTGSPN